MHLLNKLQYTYAIVAKEIDRDWLFNQANDDEPRVSVEHILRLREVVYVRNELSYDHRK